MAMQLPWQICDCRVFWKEKSSKHRNRSSLISAIYGIFFFIFLFPFFFFSFFWKTFNSELEEEESRFFSFSISQMLSSFSVHSVSSLKINNSCFSAFSVDLFWMLECFLMTFRFMYAYHYATSRDFRYSKMIYTFFFIRDKIFKLSLDVLKFFAVLRLKFS